MHITINDVIGKKTIDLSYPILNFGSSKEIAVISMLSENKQYEMTKPLKFKLVDGSEKEVLSKTYMSRELDAFVEGKHIVSDLDNDPQIIKTNKLAKVINMSLNPICTGGGVFHPMPSKWLRTPQRNKLTP